jgi:hypothetical protein
MAWAEEAALSRLYGASTTAPITRSDLKSASKWAQFCQNRPTLKQERNMTAVKSKWHNFDAYTLENDALRVIIVPERGGKIASIFDKRINREWLIQPTRFPVPVVPYGADYLLYDMNSWDEMFPTIVTDTYPIEGKYTGNPLPDHGEVWALPWSASTEGHALILTVEGRALPYRLSRKAAIHCDSAIDYSVVNTGDETLHLWQRIPVCDGLADRNRAAARSERTLQRT